MSTHPISPSLRAGVERFYSEHTGNGTDVGQALSAARAGAHRRARAEAPAPREDLQADFASFMKSSAATAAPLDRGDWRAQQASDARLNGDAYADSNPDRSVSGYYDSSVQEGDEDYLGDDD